MNKMCKNCGFLNTNVEGMPSNIGVCTAPLPDWAKAKFPLGIPDAFRNVIVEEGQTCEVFVPAAVKPTGE